MPERKNVREVPSEEVQGAGSWIKVRRPTVKEVKETQAEIDAIRNTSTSEEEEQSNIAGAYDNACVKAMKYVLAWNWVDEKDHPLPPPTNEGVHNLLTDEEMTFILTVLFGDIEKRKN